MFDPPYIYKSFLFVAVFFGNDEKCWNVLQTHVRLVYDSRINILTMFDPYFDLELEIQKNIAIDTWLIYHWLTYRTKHTCTFTFPMRCLCVIQILLSGLGKEKSTSKRRKEFFRWWRRRVWRRWRWWREWEILFVLLFLNCVQYVINILIYYLFFLPLLLPPPSTFRAMFVCAPLILTDSNPNEPLSPAPALRMKTSARPRRRSA